MDVTSGYVHVRGATLYYEMAGRGHPLVLVHGGSVDLRMWDEQFRPLARHYRVIRYDLRGYGRSSAEELGSPDRQDLFELLKTLQIDRAYVCGLSAGGYVAVDFALEHPNIVDALIAVSCGFSGHKPPERRSEAEDALLAGAQEARERSDLDGLVELGVLMWVDGPGQPPDRVPRVIRDRFRTLHAANIATTERRRRHSPLHLDPPAAARLSEIPAPTLIIVGDLDTTTIRSAMDIMAERIPRARKVVFTGCAHLLNMERPEQFNRIVGEFLRDIEPANVHP